eukprot:TRINITY_DN59090_c0_g1_i1.p1 TRINITY_DN59090_c0_g1~~TRINITY_DN59090_c0_g1_i1.p1  ORF type:complete len:260 (+),score=48.24 TRINITY_DN59090_c0_g1_i1:71-850(+)
MLRRTVTRHWVDPLRNDNSTASYLAWTPEIRMLDKDERLVEPTLGAKQRVAGTTMITPSINYPPMDPLNPTWEQRRAVNTNVNLYPVVDHTKSTVDVGFRTIPEELIDWRSTTYGEGFEELPYINEKTAYTMPDYTVAGLLRNKDEELVYNDNVPRTAETGTFGRPLNPKIVAFNVFNQTTYERNNRHGSLRRLLHITMFMFLAYKLTNMDMRYNELRARRTFKWWDGGNAGTWKYGGAREIYKGHALSGGSLVPVLEW